MPRFHLLTGVESGLVWVAIHARDVVRVRRHPVSTVERSAQAGGSVLSWWCRWASAFLLVCGASWAAFASAPDTPASRLWYERALVGIEVGPTGAQFGYSDPKDQRYAARLNGREIVQRCRDAHSEYAVVWARDGDFAYYNSAFLTKCPGMGDRDILLEAVAEARTTGLPVIAYCVMQQSGNYLAEHPEFAQRDDQGRILVTFCFNSGYLEEMKRMAKEQLDRGVDGFHFDMLVSGFASPCGCWCDTCRREFKAKYGHDMPAKEGGWDAAWDEALEYRYMSVQRFMRDLYAYVKSVNPRASVDFNYHGNPPFSWETAQRPVQHAANADFVTGETGSWSFTPLFVGLNTRFYQAAAPHQRVQIAMSRDVRMYHNQTTRPVNDLRWEVLTAAAHGAFITMVDKAAFDGSLDPVAYERIGAAFADARARRAEFGQPLVAEVGLYFSSRTRDWYGRARQDLYFPSFAGAHKAMVYEHIPWRVVLDENTAEIDPPTLPVVVLADTACLSAREVAMFTRYVRAGGNLIVTGEAGTRDVYGAPAGSTVLEELIGARLAGRLDTTDNWMRFAADARSDAADALLRGIRRDWPFLVKGPAVIYAPTTAEAFGELMKPYRTVRQREGKESTAWPMSAEVAVGPAVLVNRLGRGRVVTFAGSPDYSTASEHRILETRHLLAAAVRWLNPNPRIRISAPLTVEAVVTDDPVERVLRVHLLGYNAPPQNMPPKRWSLENLGLVMPEMIEDLPLYRAQIELSGTFRGASAWSPQTQLSVEGPRVTATVNDVHDVIRIRY